MIADWTGTKGTVYRNNFVLLFIHCKYVMASIAFIRRNTEIRMVLYTSKYFFFFRKVLRNHVGNFNFKWWLFLRFWKRESSMYPSPPTPGPKLYLVFKYILLWDIAHVLLPLYFRIHADHLSFSFSWVMKNYMHLSCFRRTAVILYKITASSLYLPLQIIGNGNPTWWTTRQLLHYSFSVRVCQE